jgi:hypothetical protein
MNDDLSLTVGFVFLIASLGFALFVRIANAISDIEHRRDSRKAQLDREAREARESAARWEAMQAYKARSRTPEEQAIIRRILAPPRDNLAQSIDRLSAVLEGAKGHHA